MQRGDLARIERQAQERDEELQQQLVKNDRIVDERPNEKAKKISEHDNRVEHETTAPLRRLMGIPRATMTKSR